MINKQINILCSLSFVYSQRRKWMWDLLKTHKKIFGTLQKNMKKIICEGSPSHSQTGLMTKMKKVVGKIVLWSFNNNRLN